MSQKDNNLATASRWLPTPLLALGLLLLPALAIALGGSGAGPVEIPVSTISSGGGQHSVELTGGSLAGSTLVVDFTIGSAHLGSGEGPDGIALAGAYQLQREAIESVSGIEGVRFRRGDGNDDSIFNIADGIASLEYLFLGGELTCKDAGDANDDGIVNMADAITVFEVLFLGADPVPAPGSSNCGLDPTDDDLDCDSYNSC
ncbi:MAG: hypothetical protein VX764_03820 [Planctomycetota bacterium]|nr:hypothetical protein [Planctomycetota bacterium]